MTTEEKAAVLDWILKKWKIPPDASKTDIYGKMHVAYSAAMGYNTYIKSYRCNHKQGEIARLTTALSHALHDLDSSFGLIVHDGNPEHTWTLGHPSIAIVRQELDNLNTKPHWSEAFASPDRLVIRCMSKDCGPLCPHWKRKPTCEHCVFIVQAADVREALNAANVAREQEEESHGARRQPDRRGESADRGEAGRATGGA